MHFPRKIAVLTLQYDMEARTVLSMEEEARLGFACTFFAYSRHSGEKYAIIRARQFKTVRSTHRFGSGEM